MANQKSQLKTMDLFDELSDADLSKLVGGLVVGFSGQRSEGFYVDLGAVFDVGDLKTTLDTSSGSGKP